MFCDYIRIAVAGILNDPKYALERCCGSCNPSCDDLTRFICFGHTLEEINAWINEHPDELSKALQAEELKMDADYFSYCQARDEEDKLDFAKAFCLDCPKFIEARDAALDTHNSVFDAAVDIENFQKSCMKDCIKFNEAYIAR